MGSHSFCSGDSVSPPAQGPADSTSLFPPSSGSLLASRKAARANSLSQLSSRINPALVCGQSSLTPPHNAPNMMAPYNPAEMSSPYYPPRRSQQPAAPQFPLNHAPTHYHSGPPPYSAYPPPYGGNSMSGQGYPPPYGTLPPYYNQGSSASPGYSNSTGSLTTDSNYMTYPDPHQPTPAAMLPSRPAYVTDAQTENSGMYNGSYSTAMSSPCSSTHSETATTQMESTLKEFVTSVATTSPSAAASVSPNAANGLSPSMQTQQSMEVDSLPAEEMKLVMEEGEGVSGDRELEDKDEDAPEDQNMAERYVCMWCVCVCLWYACACQNAGVLGRCALGLHQKIPT